MIWALAALEFALVAQLGLGPLLAAVAPRAGARYRRHWRRLLPAQFFLALSALVAVATLPRPY